MKSTDLNLAEKAITLETTVKDRPAIPDILQEHLEEVAYLSIQRRKLLFSPEIPLRRLKNHSERITAHLDALQVGGPASVAMAESMLDGDDPWFVYSAALIWLQQGQPDPGRLYARLLTVPPPMRCAWNEVFRQLPSSTSQQFFSWKDAEALPPAVLEIAADAWAWHGLLSPDMASKLANSPAAILRRSVARNAPSPAILETLLDDKDTLVLRCALWSLALQNPRAALERCRQAVKAAERDPFDLRVLGLLGDRADGPTLLPFCDQEKLAPAALYALRDLACPEFSEALFGLLEGDAPESAAVARAVFESLAGRMPAADPAQPLPPGTSPARFHWEQVRKNLDLSRRTWHGLSFPWKGQARDEPMGLLWRRILSSPAPELMWLRREVPDGFFTGFDADEAIPGE